MAIGVLQIALFQLTLTVHARFMNAIIAFAYRVR